MLDELLETLGSELLELETLGSELLEPETLGFELLLEKPGLSELLTIGSMISSLLSGGAKKNPKGVSFQAGPPKGMAACASLLKKLVGVCVCATAGTTMAAANNATKPITNIIRRTVSSLY